jgi:hypothetical protein
MTIEPNAGDEARLDAIRPNELIAPECRSRKNDHGKRRTNRVWGVVESGTTSSYRIAAA